MTTEQEQLFEKWKLYALTIARHFVFMQSAYKDLSSEVGRYENTALIGLWQAVLRHDKVRSNWKSYLIYTVKHRIIDEQRASNGGTRRHPENKPVELPEGFDVASIDASFASIDALDEMQLIDRILSKKRFDGKRREIFELFYKRGLAVDEIAKQYKISVDNVWTVLCKTRQLLREEMERRS